MKYVECYHEIVLLNKTRLYCIQFIKLVSIIEIITYTRQEYTVNHKQTRNINHKALMEIRLAPALPFNNADPLVCLKWL